MREGASYQEWLAAKPHAPGPRAYDGEPTLEEFDRAWERRRALASRMNKATLEVRSFGDAVKRMLDMWNHHDLTIEDEFEPPAEWHVGVDAGRPDDPGSLVMYRLDDAGNAHWRAVDAEPLPRGSLDYGRPPRLLSLRDIPLIGQWPDVAAGAPDA